MEGRAIRTAGVPPLGVIAPAPPWLDPKGGGGGGHPTPKTRSGLQFARSSRLPSTFSCVPYPPDSGSDFRNLVNETHNLLGVQPRVG